jgi:hypothetical protein
MLEWWLGGGWIMGFLALSGGFAIAAGLGFARFPRAEKLPRIESLCSAVRWAVVTGVAADLAAVGTKVPENPAWAHSPDLHLLLLTGLAESLAPAILGGALLSVVGLLRAVGHGRMGKV